MSDGAYLYILRCVDGSYYTGTARSGLEQRVAEHNAGTYGGYTAQRRPVTLVFSQWFERITDAIAAERPPSFSEAAPILRDAALRAAPQDEGGPQSWALIA